MFYLGFDLGSSSVKAALIDSGTGKTVGVATYPEKEMEIIAKQPGGPNKTLIYGGKTVVKSPRKLLAQTGVSSKDIKGIGIAYQMHGMVIVDKNQEGFKTIYYMVRQQGCRNWK